MFLRHIKFYDLFLKLFLSNHLKLIKNLIFQNKIFHPLALSFLMSFRSTLFEVHSHITKSILEQTFIPYSRILNVFTQLWT